MAITTLTMSGVDTDPGSTANLACGLITVTAGSIAIDTDAPPPFGGPRAALFTGTSVSGGCYMRDTWTGSTAVADSYLLRIATLPSAETEFANFMNSGSAQLAYRLTAAGRFKITTAAAVTLWTGTVVAGAGWYLLRTWALQDSAAGQFKFDWSTYSSGLFTPVEASGLVTGVNTGTLNFTGHQVGMKRTGTMTGVLAIGGTRWNDPAAADLIPYPSRVGSGTAPITIGTAAAGYHKQTGTGTGPITVGASGAGKKRTTATGTAGIGIGAAGTGSATLPPRGGSGTAPIGIGAVGTGYAVRKGSGTAPIAIATTGTGAKRSTGNGTAWIGVGPSRGTGLRRSIGTGQAPILVGASGTGTHKTLARNLNAVIGPPTTHAPRIAPPTAHTRRIPDPTE